MFAALHQWATSNTASPITRFWLSTHPLLLLVLGFGCLIAFLVATPSSSTTLKEKGRALVAKGVSSSDHDEALRLLLALQSDYAGENPTTGSGKSLAIAGVLFLLAIALTVPPAIVIGIGAGDQRLRRWRAWLKFLFVFIPGAILLPFVINILANRF